ncbi:hypothetical protein [Streptomyces sp. 8L]|uniref:hypothetical protein n=1 Tax=Streptomyces sp. 8L TaxID=2877242 RepID=UPI001CD4DA51|nr:hypothetical protein [Streptomyces sp. 8L]MCA1217761.1 hypothetical protein [Streptomyces sp. 8L]
MDEVAETVAARVRAARRQPVRDAPAVRDGSGTGSAADERADAARTARTHGVDVPGDGLTAVSEVDG